MTDLGPLPAGFFSIPSGQTKIDFATSNTSHAGTYTVTVTATDSVSGLANNSIVYTIKLYAITDVDIVAATAMADQTYHVGATAL